MSSTFVLLRRGLVVLFGCALSLLVLDRAFACTPIDLGNGKWELRCCFQIDEGFTDVTVVCGGSGKISYAECDSGCPGCLRQYEVTLSVTPQCTWSASSPREIGSSCWDCSGTATIDSEAREYTDYVCTPEGHLAAVPRWVPRRNGIECTNLTITSRPLEQDIIKRNAPECKKPPSCRYDPVRKRIVTEGSNTTTRCTCVAGQEFEVVVNKCTETGRKKVTLTLRCGDDGVLPPPPQDEECCPPNAPGGCANKPDGSPSDLKCWNGTAAICRVAEGCKPKCRCCDRSIAPGQACDPESFGPGYCKPGESYRCPDGSTSTCPPDCVKRCKCTPCPCYPHLCKEAQPNQKCPNIECDPNQPVNLTRQCPGGRVVPVQCDRLTCKFTWSCDDDPPPPEPPCVADVKCFANGREVQCFWQGRMIVKVDVPCPLVIREPYPRGTVGLPNRFTIQGGTASAQGSQSFDVYQREVCTEQSNGPHVAEYIGQITIAMNPDATVWEMDERPNNLGKESDNIVSNYIGDDVNQRSPELVQRAVGEVMSRMGGLTIRGQRRGATIYHIYETSSFDKPVNGPAWPLGSFRAEPSYQVNVSTLWQLNGMFWYKRVDQIRQHYPGGCPDGLSEIDLRRCKCQKAEPPTTSCGWEDVNCRDENGKRVCDREYKCRSNDNIDCPVVKGPFPARNLVEFYNFPGALDYWRLQTRDPVYDRQCGIIAVPIQKIQTVIRR